MRVACLRRPQSQFLLEVVHACLQTPGRSASLTFSLRGGHTGNLTTTQHGTRELELDSSQMQLAAQVVIGRMDLADLGVPNLQQVGSTHLQVLLV